MFSKLFCCFKIRINDDITFPINNNYFLCSECGTVFYDKMRYNLHLLNNHKKYIKI